MKKALAYILFGILIDRALFSLGMYIGLIELYAGHDGSLLSKLSDYLTYYYP